MHQADAGAAPAVHAGTPLLFAVLLFVDSLHFIFARALMPLVPPTTSAMYVLLIASTQVAVFGLATRRLNWRLATAHWRFFLIVGFLVATSTAINYAAVAFIDAGTASMLGKMTTLWSLAFGVFWLHERLTQRQIAGAVVAMIGVLIITFQPGEYLRAGSLMVVVSTFLYAAHAAVVKRYSAEMEFTSFFFFRLLFTGGILMAFAAVQGVLVWPSLRAWQILLLAATVDVTVSRALYYVALRRLPISLFSIILTISPVIAVLWSLLLFDTFPSPQQLLGGGMVLLGVLLATWRARR
jgi:drug/metabolite transporter (DMT)-like permease